MTKKKLIAVFALTILYLLFELAFNARLLDVVGGTASPEEVEHIETYGRTLSGIAVALFVLQKLLQRNVGAIKIAIAVGVTIVGVYWVIAEGVDRYVAHRDAEFRRMAGNTVLVQRGLVEGKLILAGMENEPGMYGKPAGKAFLALFPLMAVYVDGLEEKTRQIKTDLIEDEVARQAGGKKGYFKSYKEAMDEVRKQYTSYARIPVASDSDLEARQDEAWADYQASLAKHNWTPESVPGIATRRVVRTVQAKGIPVPNSWDPADEYTFRKSVERRYTAKMGKAARGVKVGRYTIPPGLSYEGFVAHPAIQETLREKLKLPSHVRVASVYRSDAEFDRGLYRPFLQHNGKAALKKYEAPVEDYEPGGRYEKDGLDAARAVIVPAVALFCSLLGAITHLGKLIFLTITGLQVRRTEKGTLEASPRVKKAAWATVAVVVAAILITLGNIDNNVTTSPLYARLHEAATKSEPGDTYDDRFWDWLVGHALHIVSVGQGYGYPMNEWVRTRLLQNITYGYAPANK